MATGENSETESKKKKEQNFKKKGKRRDLFDERPPLPSFFSSSFSFFLSSPLLIRTKTTTSPNTPTLSPSAGPTQRSLLRRQRERRPPRAPLQGARPASVQPRPGGLGRQRAALLGLAGQPRGLHRAAQPARPHHGPRPPLGGPPHARILHRERQEGLRHVDLFRVAALQARPDDGVDRL